MAYASDQASRGLWHLPRPLTSITLPVHIISTRRAYGRHEVLVRPVCGEGERWVEVGNVTMQEETTEEMSK